MAAQSGYTQHAPGAPLAPGGEQGRPVRRRVAWLGTLPPLARHIARTMPWVTLIAGCVAGLGYLAIVGHVAETSHSSLTPGTVRLAFLPAVAALAFVARPPYRPLTQTTPVPAWVVPAGYLLLSAPVLALTCWAELRVVAHTIPPHTASNLTVVYPLIAQLIGWCAVSVAAAACVERSRYADLGGAVAVPASFAAIALVWYLPVSARFVAEPAASSRDATIAWYCIAALALVLTGLAMRDQWHRYGRRPRRG